MLRCLSRLLRQTKSALKALSIIAIGHATSIQIHVVARLMFKNDLLLLLESILSRATSSLARTRNGMVQNQAASHPLRYDHRAPCRLGGSLFKFEAKVLSCPSKRAFYLIKFNKDHDYLFLVVQITIKRLHGAYLLIYHILPLLASPNLL